MADRVSVARRIQVRNLAHEEIKRYAHDHALWHKHIHNVDLDAVQILKQTEMDEHQNTVDNSCRRTGKTSAKEMYTLKKNACTPDQELGIIAPREAQSLENLRYHLEAIDRSQILSAYIDYRNGRRQKSDTYYQFANRSKARAFGVMSEIDGSDFTHVSFEEYDELPVDRLQSKILPALSGTRRLGANPDSNTKPEIRITGVFKGADGLAQAVDSGEYHLLQTVNVYLGIKMGVIDEEFIGFLRRNMTSNEFIRQCLCLNIAAKNLIWETWVRKALQIGILSKLEWAAPLPGAQYKKRGVVTIGYDASGHGENPTASRHAVVVAEQIGNFIFFPFARTWPPGTDEVTIKQELIALWQYFDPDDARGDAYAVGMLTELNHSLFRLGLTTTDIRSIGDGSSTASTWDEWPFKPTRFEGMLKHTMVSSLRSCFHQKRAVIPPVDEGPMDEELTDEDLIDQRRFVRQLVNIRQDVISKQYASYKMVDVKIGDDLFDAATQAVWCLAQRGIDIVGTILIGSQTRQQLLGQSA